MQINMLFKSFEDKSDTDEKIDIAFDDLKRIYKEDYKDDEPTFKNN